MRPLSRFIITMIVSSASLSAYCQHHTEDDIPPAGILNKLSRKIDAIQNSLDKKTKQYLHKFERQEQKLYAKLYRKDSTKAKELFGDVNARYIELQNKTGEQALRSGSFSAYNNKLDSLNTAFKFLNDAGVANPALKDKITQGLNATGNLQNSLNQSEQIKTFLKERRQLLAAQLEQFGLLKELKEFNKEVYYYKQQVREYRELLNNSEKLQRKLLDLALKVPAFKEFFSRNSMLASLFGTAGSPTPSLMQASLASLQSRTQVNQLIQQTVAAGGPNAMSVIQTNLQQAQSQLNELKNRINALGNGGNNDADLPDFKPNTQRTKSFLQRLEFGTNIQTNKATNFFPVQTDLGLSVGYKLNDKSVVGVGASYKIGFGTSWRNMELTNQGASIRSFLEYKLKKNFYVAGGYELNYRSEFNRQPQLNGLSEWQKSGLLGLSKTVSLKTKFFKKTKVQLMWDFLSYQEVPKTQPIVFRVGYNF